MIATASALAGHVRRGERLAAEVVREAVAAIFRADPQLGCFTDVIAHRAIADAERIDETVARGGDPGPLAGVPFAAKNLFDIAGIKTRAGSVIELDRPEPERDAAAVTRLRRAGAVLVGATNMDEYAHGFTTENAHYGTTRNPREPSRVAGGSSGGSAAAIAAGFVPIALGSDTNGSIRVPSALCGVFGLKPTFGRVSRAGSVLFATSLDHVGPLARSTADLAAAYDALQGHDPADPASLDTPVHLCGPSLNRGAEGLRLAVAGGHFRRIPDSTATEAVDRIATAIGVDRIIDVPGSSAACAAASIITSAEAGQRHAGALRTRAHDYDPAVRGGLIAGMLLPAAPYLEAQRFRRYYQEQVRSCFRDVDVLITATTPCQAPRIGQRTMNVDGEELLVGMSLGLLTQPWSLAGLPAMSVPVRGRDGLPVGVQLVAAPLREEALFRTAAELEALGVLDAPAVAAGG